MVTGRRGLRRRYDARIQAWCAQVKLAADDDATCLRRATWRARRRISGAWIAQIGPQGERGGKDASELEGLRVEEGRWQVCPEMWLGFIHAHSVRKRRSSSSSIAQRESGASPLVSAGMAPTTVRHSFSG